MQHSIPKISEVNLELIDVHYYFDEEIEIEDIYKLSCTSSVTCHQSYGVARQFFRNKKREIYSLR